VANRNVQLADVLSKSHRNLWSIFPPSQRAGTLEGIIGFQDANQTHYYFNNETIKSRVLYLLTHPTTEPFNIIVDGVKMVFLKKGNQNIMQVEDQLYQIFSHEPRDHYPNSHPGYSEK